MTESSNFYFDDPYADALESPVFTYIDNNSSSKNKFVSGEMASPNFDGFIPKTTSSVSVRDIKAGYEILIESASSTQLYPIVRVDPSDVSIGEPDQCDVFYLTPDGLQQITYAPTTTSAVVRYEDWDNKFLNGSGWIITQQGNAIFSNVAIRGRVEANSGYIGNNTSGWEIGSDLLSNASVGFYAPSVVSGEIAIFAGSPFASRATAPFRVKYDGSMVSSNASITGNLTATTLDVGGANGIIYNGSAVTIGASVTINAPVTVNSLQVGASPTLLRIADDVSGSNDGIYINANNYWYSDGQFSVGGSANNAVWTGTSLTVTGAINATNITSSVGNIAGFTLANNQMSTASVIVSSSGGFRLGNPTIFSVDQFGNLVATAASITGNITANSGAFTGSISAQHITASTGTIAGFNLSNNQLSTASVIVSSSGGFRLGNPAIFSVDQYGNLVAQNASITGNINATSGSFSGDITAAAGRFTGSITINSGGKLISGNTNNGVLLDDTGITGYSGGLTMFRIPTTGSPTLAGFTIINTGLTGSGTNANIVVGNTGSAANSITIRGDKTGGQAAAIYTVASGVATSSGTGNGFYIDDLGRMRLAGPDGSLTFDGNNLSVTGSINAQRITASVGTIGGFALSASSLTASADATTAIGMTTGASAFFAGATSRTGGGAQFWVSRTGSVFANAVNITGNIVANSGRFTGSVVAQHIDAQSGLFSGNLTTTGTIYASNINAAGTGQRVEISSTGISGYNQIGEPSFYLASGSSSLVTDGGFELQGAGGTAIGAPWSTFWGGAGNNASVTVETGIVKGGSKSLRISASTTGRGFLQSVDQNIAVTPGTTYDIGAYVYSASTLNISNGFVEIWVLESSNAGYPSYFNSQAALKIITPATGVSARTWTKINGKYTAASPYAVLALRSYSTTSSAFIVWDSIEMSTGQSISKISGFSFNDDILFSDYVTISSQGTAIFGQPTTSITSSAASAVSNTANFLSISGIDPTYRMWVGNSDPNKAFFSVQKDGTVNVAEGGDIVLTSSSAGTSDSDLSRIEFYKRNGSVAAQIKFTPSSSALLVGTVSDSDMKMLNLRAGTTGGSVVFSGTLYNGKFGNVVTIGTESSAAGDEENGHYLGTNGYVFHRRDSNTQTDSVMFLHKFNSAGSLTSGSQSMITFVLDGTNRGRLVAFTTGAQPALLGISDRRAKTDIVPFEDASSLIKQLNLYSFKWAESGKSENGFIADEVQQVIPSAIFGDPNETDEYGKPVYQEIAETKMLCYAIGALKEALVKIDQLEDRIRLLEGG